MISTMKFDAVFGTNRAAASARPSLAPTFGRALEGELCAKHVERFAGIPATPTTSVRRRNGVGDLPVITINKFAFRYQSVPGSSVWRPPV